MINHQLAIKDQNESQIKDQTKVNEKIINMKDQNQSWTDDSNNLSP